MRMWLDTEFNSYGGELISIAIVTEDHNEFYEVLQMTETPVEWVAANVMPHLEKTAVPRMSAQQIFYRFLDQYNFGRCPEGVEIIADHPADFMYLCELCLLDPFGTGIHRLETPAFSMSLHFGLESTAEKSAVPHNALEDAKALRASHLKLESERGLL